MPQCQSSEEYEKWKAELAKQMVQHPPPPSAPSHLTGADSTPKRQVDSYIRRNLRSGETIVLDARITPIQTWATIVLFSVLFGPIAVAMMVISIRDREPGRFALALLVGLLFVLLPSFYYYVKYKRIELCVTNMRVVEKTGVLADRAVHTALDQIQNVVYKQPVLGKIFGYGTVIIQSTDTSGSEEFHNVRNPRKVRDAILQQTERYRQERNQAQAEAIAVSMLRDEQPVNG